jgi:hypothetical protein
MSGLFTVIGRSFRGVRLLEALALALLLMMVLGNYLAKARAGRERGEISAVEAQIGDEQHRMRALAAEVAHLEQPERLERLSVAAGLRPTGASHQGSPDHLPQFAQTSVSAQTPGRPLAGADSRWGGAQ